MRTLDLCFRSTEREVTDGALTVTGVLPAWLRGTLYRNGPARFEVGATRCRHWFDGLAMLHAFTFSSGTVGYRGRFLRSAAFQEAERAGRLARSEFATDPDSFVLGRASGLRAAPMVTDNCNVNVAQLGDALFAVGETPVLQRLDGSTLEALGPLVLEDGLGGQLFSPHPLRDPARRQLVNFQTSFGARAQITFFTLAEGARKRRLLCNLESAEAAYMHSFGMSEKHLVLTECPLVASPAAMRAREKPFIENYAWRGDRPTRFTLISRANGKVRATFEAEPFYAYHHVNVFEDGDDVCVDLLAYPDASTLASLYLDSVRSGAPVRLVGQLRRYVLSPGAAGRTAHRVLSPVELELPSIHEAAHAGRPYRYVYGASSKVEGNFLDQLVKVDAQGGAALSWQQAGCHPSEPLFVPSPSADGAQAEDDGVVLSVVLDTQAASSFLLALEASTFRELGRASVPLPLSFGLHGTYVAASA